MKLSKDDAAEPAFARLLQEAVETGLMAEVHPGPRIVREADDAYHALMHYPGLPLHVIVFQWQYEMEKARTAREQEANDGGV